MKYRENKTDFARAVLCALLISILFSFVLSERGSDKERNCIPRAPTMQYDWDGFGMYRGRITYSPAHCENLPIPPSQKQCLYCRDTIVLSGQRNGLGARDFWKIKHERFALLWIVFYFVYLVGDYINSTQPSGDESPAPTPSEDGDGNLAPSTPQQNMLQHKQAAKRFRTYFNKKRAKLPFLVLGWFLFLMQAYHVDDVKKSAVFGIGGLILVSLVVHFEQFGTKWVKRVRMAENIAMICAMLCYLCRCGCPCDPWLTDILLWGLPITTFVCVWLFREEKE